MWFFYSQCFDKLLYSPNHELAPPSPRVFPPALDFYRSVVPPSPRPSATRPLAPLARPSLTRSKDVYLICSQNHKKAKQEGKN